jgi:protein-S-isoprenylcysteine O-methyltransferase Ste14
MRPKLSRWLPIAGILPALLLGSLGAETAGSHPVGWFLAALAVAYLAVVPFRASMVNALGIRKSGSSGSLWLVVSGSLGVLLAAPVEHLTGSGVLTGGDLLEAFGAVCGVGGAALGAWAQVARRTVSHAQGRTDQLVSLLQRGPYRAVRHPFYSALLLAALGVALGYGSAVAVAILVCLLLPGVALRIRVEERQMLERLGGAYRDYARRTQRLVPRVW